MLESHYIKKSAYLRKGLFNRLYIYVVCGRHYYKPEADNLNCALYYKHIKN